MSDKHLADSHLDAAIDRAVREMMSVEPRADMRQRVMARIAGEPARPAMWPRLLLGSAALAMAIFLISLIVKQPAERPVAPTVVQSQTPASQPARTPAATGQAAAPPPQVAGQTPDRPSGPRPRAVTPRPSPSLDRQVQAASINTTEPMDAAAGDGVERLPPIVPLGIARLDAPVATIVIRPIAIEPIEITLLGAQR